MATDQNKVAAVPSPATHAPVTEQTIRQLLDVQSRELDLRQQEIAHRAKELDNNAAHAEKILNAQTEDRQDHRKFLRSSRQDILIFAGFLAFLVVGFSVYGFTSGNGGS